MTHIVFRETFLPSVGFLSTEVLQDRQENTKMAKRPSEGSHRQFYDIVDEGYNESGIHEQEAM
jgi:hypothetical protein